MYVIRSIDTGLYVQVTSLDKSFRWISSFTDATIFDSYEEIDDFVEEVSIPSKKVESVGISFGSYIIEDF